MKKINSIFVFILSLLVVSTVSAYDYDSLLIRAQASIFPKILMLDTNLSQKTQGNTITIVILSTEEDKDVAHEIKKLMTEKYNNKLGENILSVQVSDFKDIKKTETATAYLILKAPKAIQKNVTSIASAKNRIVFSYDHNNFKNNVLISVIVKEKTYIYLNKQALHKYDIKFRPIFYKVAKIIE